MSNRIFTIPRRALFSTLSVLLVSSPAWPAQTTATEDFTINAGLAGSWYNPETSGQGFFVDVDPASHTLFIAWFTHGVAPPGASSIVGSPHNRWFVAQGTYSEGSTEVPMDLLETEGGIFDNAAAVANLTIGNLTLNFLNCSEASVEFAFDDGSAQGHIDLSRLTSAEVCEALADNSNPE